MRTRSQSRNNFSQQEASPVIIEPLRIELPFLEDQFQEDPPPEVPMADNRTMAELLQAPTEGYEDAIVILKIAANHFELKHGLINRVQNKQFFGHDKEDPHAHICYFNKITSTMRVPSSSIKLMLFPFSLEGAARIWLEKELPRSILTWDDLLSKFINQFFPLLKTTNLRNEITRFQQRVDESFYEAWDRLNDLLRACPHHGFFELHQLDTFYNALNVNHQDLLNSTAGGNLLDKMPRECLKIIESKSKDLVRALLLDKKNQSSAPAPSSTPAPVKAIEQIVLLVVVLTRTKIVPLQAEMLIEITSKSQLHRPQVNQPPAYQALAYQAPNPQTQIMSQTDFESYIEANDAVLRNMQNQGQNVQNQCQSLQIQMANLTDMLSKFVRSNTASSSGSGALPSNTITNPKVELKGITTRSGVAYQGPTIPTQSKVVKQGTKVTKDQVQTPSSQSTAPAQPLVIQPKTQTLIFKPVVAPMPNLKSSIPYPSRRDNERHALILMPKFASTLKALIRNKEKLSEIDRTPMNEHYSTVILNKLPRKIRDPSKFLIPCEFPGMDECLTLADLGASINLMPLSVWEALSLLELTPTCMTLELADRLVSKPIGIAKDVSFKVGVFHFPVDFMVVDFNPDPRVPLILERCFLKTGRALIDVHKGELTLLLGFSDVTASGNPTPHDDPIVSTTSPTLTPFGDNDFLLFEEADAFLDLEDDPNSPEFNPFYSDPERDILLLETILNKKTVKSSVDELPEVELKDLPPHLKYAFLEGNNKFPVIIAKELGDEEKSALIMVLKSHKRAIAWKLSDKQGINREFCTHKILIEEDYKPAVQHQRLVNPK
nr:reverse transcriptase domain-containing protein [Tanacetum cinerariifolium]